MTVVQLIGFTTTRNFARHCKSPRGINSIYSKIKQNAIHFKKVLPIPPGTGCRAQKITYVPHSTTAMDFNGPTLQAFTTHSELQKRFQKNLFHLNRRKSPTPWNLLVASWKTLKNAASSSLALRRLLLRKLINYQRPPENYRNVQRNLKERV